MTSRAASIRRPVVVLVAAVVVAVVALFVAALAGDDDPVAGPSSSRPRPTTTSTTEPATSSSTSTSTSTTAHPTSTVPTTRPRPTTPPTDPGPAAVPIRRFETTRKVVVLTFDAGSDTGYAAQILDTLGANGIRATFGMTGKWAEANPGLVLRMAAEGHQLVNHSYDHPSFTGRSTGAAPLSGEARRAQLARAEAAVQSAAGVAMAPWFRPPYGDEDASVRADVGAAGYRYELLWTVDSLGWKGLAPSAVIDRCLGGAAPGAIYLFHVGAASTDHAALQPIIDGLRGQGYAFATAADLLAAG